MRWAPSLQVAAPFFRYALEQVIDFISGWEKMSLRQNFDGGLFRKCRPGVSRMLFCFQTVDF